MYGAAPNLAALAKGTVRGRHVVVLFALIFLLAFAVAYWLSLHSDPLYRNTLRECVWGLAIFAFFAVVTSIVPELRRLFLEVIHAGRSAPPSDVLITIAVMITWGLGTSRMLFKYPLFLYDQDAAFAWTDMGMSVSPGSMYMLLGTLGSILLAPINEEIIFRGYLLNLWLARHSTWFAIWGSAIVFGIWHFKNAAFATGMGFIWALVYLKYRSIILCMVLHALYNVVVNKSILPPVIWDKDRTTVAELSSWSLELCLALLFVPAAWAFWKRFRPQSTITS